MLNTSIDSLQQTSPLTIKRLKATGIHTYWDFLNYFPFRYEDYTKKAVLENLYEGNTVTAQGTIVSIKNNYMRRGLTLQKVVLHVEHNNVQLTWFNQPFIIRTLSEGMTISASGIVKGFGRGQSIIVSAHEILDESMKTYHTNRLVPVYSAPHGLSSRLIRDKIVQVLQLFEDASWEDMLPDAILKKYHLISEKDAYSGIHFPKTKEDVDKARTRLGFNEFFQIQFTSELIKRDWQKQLLRKPFEIEDHKDEIDAFISQLPFALTQDQTNSLQDVMSDLHKTIPMNRLLQGDVGSGKTIIAIITTFLTYLNNQQTLIMAPTEVLAKQHFDTFNRIFSAYKGDQPEIILQTGSIKTKKENHLTSDIIIGTHALITDKITYKDIGLVIIDEQHKFGVKQRAKLREKGIHPHVLTMTATPIPRTVLLTLYKELDVSTIKEKPLNRPVIKSFITPPEKRNAGYDWIKKQIDTEHIQVYIVCPLIDESESDTLKEVKAVKKEYEYLSTEIFSHYKVALLHGQMKSTEKNKVLSDFAQGLYDILVTTPVVEVGIDIPNATIIIIEAAERFGLSQLHQLRGRVGRGTKESYCLLFTTTAETARLKSFVKIDDGFALAEMDMELRGSGDMFGTKQHGNSDLKIASIYDMSLLTMTSNAVNEFITIKNNTKEEIIRSRVNEEKLKEIAND